MRLQPQHCSHSSSSFPSLQTILLITILLQLYRMSSLIAQQAAAIDSVYLFTLKTSKRVVNLAEQLEEIKQKQSSMAPAENVEFGELSKKLDSILEYMESPKNDLLLLVPSVLSITSALLINPWSSEIGTDFFHFAHSKVKEYVFRTVAIYEKTASWVTLRSGSDR